MNCRKGISLVEVVVVSSLVLILAAIAYAATGGVRERSREAVCISNLRQVGLAISAYSMDNEGDDLEGLTGVARGAFRRPGAALRSITDRTVLMCPNSPHCEHYRMLTSYVFSAIADVDSQPNPQAFRSQQDEIARAGSAFPIVKCFMHDETYYRPSRETADDLFPKVFEVSLRADGSAGLGWRHDIYIPVTWEFCK